MIKWIITILICVALWCFIDVRSESVFKSALVPLLWGIILISVIVSALYKIGIFKGQIVPGSRGSGGGYLGGFGGDSGGDGGSSDGGC